jgi:uncharacterized protein YdgA (DUF945 family)
MGGHRRQLKPWQVKEQQRTVFTSSSDYDIEVKLYRDIPGIKKKLRIELENSEDGEGLKIKVITEKMIPSIALRVMSNEF